MPPGYSNNNTDCNDTNSSICIPVSYFIDADGDQCGSTTPVLVCSFVALPGYSVNSDDCNDNDVTVCQKLPYFRDSDYDTFGSTEVVLLCSSVVLPGYSNNDDDNCPEISNPNQEDCNQNGIGDVCDIADQTETDCNENGIPDTCENGTVSRTTGNMGPFYWLNEVERRATGVLADMNNSTTTVTLKLKVRGDLDSPAEFLTLRLNNTLVGPGLGNFFIEDGNDCDEFSIVTFQLAPVIWNRILAAGGSNVAVQISSSPIVDLECQYPPEVPLIGYSELSVVYGDQSFDCNENGIADLCDIAAGAPDCNNNYILDSCEIWRGTENDCNGNQIPDSCDIISGAIGMDLIFAIDTSGSMSDDIGFLKSQIDSITAILNPTEDRVGLLGFLSSSTVLSNLGNNIPNFKSAFLALPTTGGAGGQGYEGSDAAMKYAAVRQSDCVTGVMSPFRTDVDRIVVLFTDEGPGGCNGNSNEPGAIAAAIAAYGAGVKIVAIAERTAPIQIMTNYATQTGGVLIVGAGPDLAARVVAAIQSLRSGSGFESDCDSNGIPDSCEIDSDGDGFINACDCNPTDPTIYQPKSYFVDSDGDTCGSTTTELVCSNTALPGYSVNSNDCNDANPAICAKLSYFVDSDGDTCGSTTTALVCSTVALPGYSVNNNDCNDNNAAICAKLPYCIDSDGDGFGSSATALVCSLVALPGYSLQCGDCNDNDPSIWELKRYFVDADCDGNGSTTVAMICAATAPPCYTILPFNTDCNDLDSTVQSPRPYFVDSDGDQCGSTTVAFVCSSVVLPGYSANHDDCNDVDGSVCAKRPYFVDADGDSCGSTATALVCSSVALPGYSVNSNDCNDLNPSICSKLPYYEDIDSDGYGSGSSVLFCLTSAPPGYSPTPGDNCVAIYNPGQQDCDSDSIGDVCEIASGNEGDCNKNLIPDSCDIASGTSNDVEPNGIPDECKDDCNGNDLPDSYELAQNMVPDCNHNNIPDSCDIASGFDPDCNENQIPDSCDIISGAIGMDLIFAIDTSGSMSDDIGFLKSQIDSITAILNPTEDRVGLLGFLSSSTVLSNLGNNIPNFKSAFLALPTTGGAGGQGYEGSDAAMKYAAVRQSDCVTGVMSPFRTDVDRIVVLFTDEGPGGCNGNSNEPGAIAAAIAAYGAGVKIVAIAERTAPIQIMTNYATQTGGVLIVGAGPDLAARVVAAIQSLRSSNGFENDCDVNGVPDSCQPDCNGDGVPNSCEILDGETDKDQDGVPDYCEYARGDFDLDGCIDSIDLSVLLGCWDMTNVPVCDIDHNGVVGGGDLTYIIENWGCY